MIRQTDTATDTASAFSMTIVLVAAAMAWHGFDLSPARAQTPGDKILARSQSLGTDGPDVKKPGKIVERAAAILDALGALTERRGQETAWSC